MLVILLFTLWGAGAHTLPISYLRLQAEADYLHLELVFNPFELAFVSEVDENHDNELSPGELSAHGEVVAKRVVEALKLNVAGTALVAETAGMDPELSGHHVRMRAHYKVDARRLPVTVESELNAVTSSSHLVQVTYTCEGQQRLAQLDAQSRRVTFQPFGAAGAPLPAKSVASWKVTLGPVLLLSLSLLVMMVSVVLLFVRRQQPR